MNKQLIVDLNTTYKPVVEDLDNIKVSVFNSIYIKAEEIVKEIIKRNSDDTKVEGLETDNNIITFVGERGMGKTSTMMTFSKKLEDKKTTIDKNFYSLPMIDPSHFDRNVNIIEIIIAMMFREFENKVKDIKSTDRQELLQLFDKTYKNLKILKTESKSVYEGEYLEALMEMSASMKIKSDIENLIEKYKEVVLGNKNGYLIIKIDDMDLNTKYSYEMVEQIRKYLMIPKVIILMALKIDQLQDVIEESNYKDFANLKQIESGMLTEKVTLMSEKYLAKLIPIDRRLSMPRIDEFSSNAGLVVKYQNDEEEKEQEFDSVEEGIREIIYKKTGLHFFKKDEKENPIVPNNMRELVNMIHFLWGLEDVTKTAKENLKELIKILNEEIKDEEIKKYDFLLDVNSKLTYEEYEVLIDKEISKLKEQNEYENLSTELKSKNIYNRLSEKRDQQLKENKKEEIKVQICKFKDFILDIWSKSRLSQEKITLLNRFVNLNSDEKNKFIILELEKMFKITEKLETEINRMETDSSYLELINQVKDNREKLSNYQIVSSVLNKSFNISIGEVLFVLSIVENMDFSKEVQEMLFAIKTLYYIEMEIMSIKGESENLNKIIAGEYWSYYQGSLFDKDKNIDILNQNNFEFENIVNQVEKYKNANREFLKSTIRRRKIAKNKNLEEVPFYNLKEIKKNGEYEFSIMSALFNSNDDKKLTNIALNEHLIMIYLIQTKNNHEEDKKNREFLYWDYILNKIMNMRYYDGIGYFSTYNMEIMNLFRKSKISELVIEISFRNIVESEIQNMEKDINDKETLSEYWNRFYMEIKNSIILNFNLDQKSKIDFQIRTEILDYEVKNGLNKEIYNLNENNKERNIKNNIIKLLREILGQIELGEKVENLENIMFSKNEEKRKEYSKKLSEIAELYYKRKEYEVAKDLLKRACMIDGNEETHYNNLAVISYEMAEGKDESEENELYKEASESFRKILDKKFEQDGFEKVEE